jgi:hypothetical protein
MTKVKQMLSFIVAAVLMFSYQSIMAQATTASINGLVFDQNGNALPGANVVAVHQPSGTVYGSTAREDGRYNLVGLRVGGPYKITVSMVGFTQQVEEGISLALGQNLRIDFKLPEEAVQLSGVTITAERNAVLSQARTGAATNISAKAMQELPSVSRNFQSFAKLSPMFSYSNNSGGYTTGGRSSKYNNIQIDGAQYNDMFGLGSSGIPGGQTSMNPISLDAIEEVQIVIAPFDVRYGGFTGGGINAVTKSGSNDFSGSAYFYGRNEDLVGKNWDGTTVSKFEDYQYGFRVGGPIVKDKLFFSVAGEMTNYTFPVPNASLATGPAGTADNAAKIYNVLKNTYGYDAGSYDAFDAERPSSKMLLRFDYNLSENHKLTLRHNYTYGYDDNMNNRSSNNYLSYSTYNYRIKDITNSTVLQLNSTFSNKISNELTLGYTSIRDRRAGTSAMAPEMRVTEGGVTFVAGPDRYSSANELDQDVFEITDNFTYYAGDHAFTVGTHNEFFSFRNLFLRDFFGYMTFSSIANLEAGKTASYSRTILQPGVTNGAADFSIAQYGFYIQDEWTVSPKLKLTFGVRVDIPTFPDTPARNDSVSKYIAGYSTDVVPESALLWSPRFGFNYDLSEDRTTQLRGGLGVFTGKVPYVWISNSYGNTGTTATSISATTSSVATLINDPLNATYSKSSTKAEIDLHSTDLKMPQVLRFDLALDQQLPLGFVGTVEFQYSKSLNDMLYRKVNVGPESYKIPVIGSGADGRPVYASSAYTNTTYNNNFSNVFEIYNTSSGYQYDFAVSVQRNVTRGLSINAGYRFEKAMDRNSASSSQASSQWNYNPISGDPNNPPLTTSLWEVPHRLYVSASYTEEFFKNAPTTISVFINSQCGSPFSFVYNGDVNGDGSYYNDLFYIPRNSSEILLGSSATSYSVGNDDDAMWQALNSFIENNKYLREHRGKIAERNASYAPWSTTIDMRIVQEIPDLWGMGHFQLSLDILNVANLLNEDWGRVEDPSWYYQIATLKTTTSDKKPIFSFSKPTNNEPWTPQYAASRWAMQVGLRYSF